MKNYRSHHADREDLKNARKAGDWRIDAMDRLIRREHHREIMDAIALSKSGIIVPRKGA